MKKQLLSIALLGFIASPMFAQSDTEERLTKIEQRLDTIEHEHRSMFAGTRERALQAWSKLKAGARRGWEAAKHGAAQFRQKLYEEDMGMPGGQKTEDAYVTRGMIEG